MIKITDVITLLDYNLEQLKLIAAEKLHINQERIKSLTIEKRTVESSNKQDIRLNFTVILSILGDEDEVILKANDDKISKEFLFFYNVPKAKLSKRPVVIGCGPAGLFAALILAEAGARPIILERGFDVDRRSCSVQKFWQEGVLDLNSNIQFGEGGAGTFSDGKLNVGLKDFRKRKVLGELVQAGAPDEIFYESKPHIGTDYLHKTVMNLRKKIICLGGEVQFGATLTSVLRNNKQVIGVRYIQNEITFELDTNYVVLAIGHSARDTFELLYSEGIAMEQKPFAVGIRIEHPQKLIDQIQYGTFAGHKALGAANYRFSVHLPGGRSTYSFCMCPGGTVVAAASEENRIVTNGMSKFDRAGSNANSALIVTVLNEDLASSHPLAGIHFQRKIEEDAFKAGGGGYKAPVQRLEDFLHRCNTNTFGSVLPTYQPGTQFATMDSCLPQYITESLRQGIYEMEKWTPGFLYPDALLTGVETRSGSPVRIMRDEKLEAIGIAGLYPCGEGAGYAGGIISAAVDGMRCAEQILHCEISKPRIV